MFSFGQKFTINGDDYENLKNVLDFAMSLNENEVVSFYQDKKGLVFCEDVCYGATEYPFIPTSTVLVEQIKQYLKNLSDSEITNLAGEAPDNDGSVELGWEVFYPLWYGEDKIEKYETPSFLAVRPCWIVYSK